MEEQDVCAKIMLCVMLGEKNGNMEGQGGRVVPPSGLLSRWGVPCSLTDKLTLTLPHASLVSPTCWNEVFCART